MNWSGMLFTLPRESALRAHPSFGPKIFRYAHAAQEAAVEMRHFSHFDWATSFALNRKWLKPSMSYLTRWLLRVDFTGDVDIWRMAVCESLSYLMICIVISHFV